MSKNFDEARALADQGGIRPPAGVWSKGEKLENSPAKNQVALSFRLPALTGRRIYCHFEAKRVDAVKDFWALGEIQLLKGGQVKATLPVEIGQDANATTLSQSLTTFFPNTQPPLQDAIKVVFSGAYTGGGASGTLLLTPYRINCAADELVFKVADLFEAATSALPKYRVWIGVLSTDEI